MVLPAGMRNNNPGNIKYVGQPGTTPSVNLDQGDPQAVFSSPEAGMAAMYRLLMKKYSGGKVTPLMMIAGQGGWTPGNTQAAANVARSMGIRPDEDIGLNDPARANKFMRALMLQEHGQASLAYTDDQINAAIGGGGAAAAPTHAPSVASPQAAIDAAGPGQKPQGQTQTAMPAPGTPGGAMGPQNPPGWDGPGTAVAGADEKSWFGKLRQKLAHAATGYKMPDIAKNDTTLSALAMPGAARVDTPELPMFDQNQIAQQRQNLAMAMQRLNSGRLF